MKLEASLMTEVLSIDEMKERFPNEWILIGDPQTNPGPVLLGGAVLWHSPDRDEVYQKAFELRQKSMGFFYTGVVPQEHMEFAL
jgi:hypothetical protein